MGHIKVQSVIGIIMFTQFWYWFPYINFISLCINPICLIALNTDLNMPKGFNLISNAKPSLFAYPPPIKSV